MTHLNTAINNEDLVTLDDSYPIFFPEKDGSLTLLVGGYVFGIFYRKIGCSRIGESSRTLIISGVCLFWWHENVLIEIFLSIA